MDELDIVIATHDNLPFLQVCVETIRKSTTVPHKTIVIDDRSAGNIGEWCKAQADVSYIRNDRLDALARLWNIGILSSTSPYVCILNDDCFVSPGWDVAMLDYLKAHPGTGIVGPVTYEGLQGMDPEFWTNVPHYDGRHNQHLTSQGGIEGDLASCYGGDYFKFAKAFQDRHKDMILNFPPTYCFIVRREVFQDIGIFDPIFKRFWFEDLDFFFRVKCDEHWKMESIGWVYVHHLRSTSVIREDSYKEQMDSNNSKFHLKAHALNEIRKRDGKAPFSNPMGI